MSDPACATFLALLARAYAEPDQRVALRRELGVGRAPISFDRQQATIADFLEATIAASSDDARPRLHTLLTDLRWRPSRMPDRVLRALGIDRRRDAVLADLVTAFPVAPLDGCVIREAYLHDERGFRVVPPEEHALARRQAVTSSWRAVPDAEIEFAFSKNSVYIWLDEGALSFYLPACLSYAIRESDQCEFYTLLYFAEMSYAQALRSWTAEQCRAIAGFIAYVAADVPDRRTIVENRANIDTWLAAVG